MRNRCMQGDRLAARARASSPAGPTHYADASRYRNNAYKRVHKHRKPRHSWREHMLTAVDQSTHEPSLRDRSSLYHGFSRHRGYKCRQKANSACSAQEF